MLRLQLFYSGIKMCHGTIKCLSVRYQFHWFSTAHMHMPKYHINIFIKSTVGENLLFYVHSELLLCVHWPLRQRTFKIQLVYCHSLHQHHIQLSFILPATNTQLPVSQHYNIIIVYCHSRALRLSTHSRH